MSSVDFPPLEHCSHANKQHDSGKKVTQHKMCVWIFSTTFVQNISHSKKKCVRYDTNIGLHIQYPLFLSNFNKLEFFSIDFGKILNIKFHEDPSSGSQVPCGQTKEQT
jgi:hypothetical protein